MGIFNKFSHLTLQVVISAVRSVNSRSLLEYLKITISRQIRFLLYLIFQLIKLDEEDKSPHLSTLRSNSWSTCEAEFTNWIAVEIFNSKYDIRKAQCATYARGWPFQEASLLRVTGFLLCDGPKRERRKRSRLLWRKHHQTILPDLNSSSFRFSDIFLKSFSAFFSNSLSLFKSWRTLSNFFWFLIPSVFKASLSSLSLFASLKFRSEILVKIIVKFYYIRALDMGDTMHYLYFTALGDIYFTDLVMFLVKTFCRFFQQSTNTKFILIYLSLRYLWPRFYLKSGLQFQIDFS